MVLAEKPSVAREIASILGAKQLRQGYLEGEGWAVTWALGHLVELKEPGEYFPEWKRWTRETLPMIPEKFDLRPRGDKGARDQLKTVVSLFKQADELVCATDAGREGELIFRNIQRYAKALRKPFKRLWIHSLTPAAIKQGFDKLVEGSDYDRLYDAARCRSEADWIIGLNATRYHTVVYGQRNALWSVGRVQTPVLALLGERDREIDNFKPEPYWEVHSVYRTARFKSKRGKFDKKEDAEALLASVAPHTLVVTDRQVKEQKELPPLLYDLSALQQDMNRWFGLTADQTLSIAQSLYEAKFITYPRTDSRYLSADLGNQLPGLVEKLRTQYPQEVAPIDPEKLALGKRIVDDTKVTDHHAIIPTEVIPHNLSPDQHKVYDSIVRRLLAAFYPPVLKEVTVVDAEVHVPDVDAEAFQARGTVLKDAGWQNLYPHLQNRAAKKKNPDDDQQDMPSMTVGESGPHEPELMEKMTKPPKRYTEASLLKRMETAGKLVEDEALREAMKQRGLGTPATRAAIIETLLQRKYILRQKKNLITTQSGQHLLRLVQDPSLKSPELTGEWEAKLVSIEKGDGNAIAFMEEVVEHARHLVHPTSRPDLGPCPCCGEPIIEGKTGYGCSKWKEGCEYVLKRDQFGIAIETSLAAELFHTGKSLKAIPLVLDGSPVLGKLRLSGDGVLSAKAIGNATVSANQKSLGTCPLCGGAVLAGKQAYGCSNWKQGCPFRIWKKIAKKTVTQAVVKELLEKGYTDTLDGFTSKAGKTFSTKLKLENGEVKFDFG